MNDHDGDEILSWVDKIKHEETGNNYHVNEVAKMLNGKSFMFDLSKSELTKFISSEQSGENVINESVPTIITRLVDKISQKIQIPDDNVFLQVLDMQSGGTIKPHYDVAVPGFINFKCNLSVLSEDYSVCIENNIFKISEKDLYCFEASLYKHWTMLPFNSRRVLLSFGFILPLSSLQRSEDDPRVRLSNRIQKYFQKNNL